MFLQVRWPNQQCQSTEGGWLVTQIALNLTRLISPRYNNTRWMKHCLNSLTDKITSNHDVWLSEGTGSDTSVEAEGGKRHKNVIKSPSNHQSLIWCVLVKIFYESDHRLKMTVIRFILRRLRIIATEKLRYPKMIRRDIFEVNSQNLSKMNARSVTRKICRKCSVNQIIVLRWP